MAITLSVEKVSKDFGGRVVFRDLSFSVTAPGSLGITGRNGSGKTTLLRVLSQLLPPTKGEVIIRDDDSVVDSGDRIRYVKMISPEMALYEMLTGYENLKFFATLAGRRLSQTQQDELLESVGLSSRGKDYVAAYSSGMKQRLKYAVALLSRPEILLLDEPTANLDDAGKKIVGEIMARQAKERLLFVATNEAEDLEHVERVIRLDS